MKAVVLMRTVFHKPVLLTNASQPIYFLSHDNGPISVLRCTFSLAEMMLFSTIWMFVKDGKKLGF